MRGKFPHFSNLLSFRYIQHLSNIRTFFIDFLQSFIIFLFTIFNFNKINFLSSYINEKIRKCCLSWIISYSHFMPFSHFIIFRSHSLRSTTPIRLENVQTFEIWRRIRNTRHRLLVERAPRWHQHLLLNISQHRPDQLYQLLTRQISDNFPSHKYINCLYQIYITQFLFSDHDLIGHIRSNIFLLSFKSLICSPYLLQSLVMLWTNFKFVCESNEETSQCWYDNSWLRLMWRIWIWSESRPKWN